VCVSAFGEGGDGWLVAMCCDALLDVGEGA
jgi:hypothetical protein